MRVRSCGFACDVCHAGLAQSRGTASADVDSATDGSGRICDSCTTRARVSLTGQLTDRLQIFQSKWIFMRTMTAHWVEAKKKQQRIERQRATTTRRDASEARKFAHPEADGGWIQAHTTHARDPRDRGRPRRADEEDEGEWLSAERDGREARRYIPKYKNAEEIAFDKRHRLRCGEMEETRLREGVVTRRIGTAAEGGGARWQDPQRSRIRPGSWCTPRALASPSPSLRGSGSRARLDCQVSRRLVSRTADAKRHAGKTTNIG